MEFYPYTMKCKRNVVDKTKYITNLVDSNGNKIVYDNFFIRERTGLFDIEIIMEFNNDSTDKKFLKPSLSGLNYIKIPKFDRYYFVNDMEFDNAMRLILKCTCDVLHTYHSAILGSTQIITRNEKSYNGEYPDPKFPILSRKTVIPTNITGCPFSSNSMASGKKCIVLTVTGGV